MRDNLTCYSNKFILTLFIFFIGSGAFLKAQESISGIINKYAKVTAISPGYVIVSDLVQAGQFSAGDYVLLIQMQGVGIQTVQNAYGVNVQSQFGKPGGYELLVVQAVNTLTGRIDFTRNVFINAYDVAGNLQLIRLPFYNSPVVTATLGSQSWNSTTGTGGVVAMMVGRKLTLEADIDVTGQGLSGAAGVSGIGECIFTNEAANNHDSYPLSWNNAGLKGEGIAIHDLSKVLLYPNHAKGQGRNFTGGGGGNGWFSGGGGGSNRGKGADGGLEKYVAGLCGNDPRDGGYGGMNIIGTIIQDGIFAGGGGGASTQFAGSTASSGANGGGIVIIIADTIVGNGHSIRSNGNSAENAVSDAGAGGGGGGGSVVISFQTISGSAVISSNGGNGGTNPGGFGNGGGGGGGLIWLSSSSVPADITSALVNYGTPAPTIPVEGTGEIKFNYSPNLNGFLFNSIWSTVTSTRIDSACSNMLAGQMNGTRPIGGTPPYTFLWESSTTSATTGFAAAPGTNNLQNYASPVLLTQNTWFRRVVTDNGAAITDVSLPLLVEVHPFIKNNVIGDPDTLCYGQNPPLLNSRAVLQDGNGIYSYGWQSSTDNVIFTNVTASGESYLPPAGLTQTTWYRRIVTSGSCSNASAAVRINVLDTIGNNKILTLPQEICEGMSFVNLEGTVAPALTGGDNIYRFRWEKSTDGSVWAAGTGPINGANYNPEEIAPDFPGSRYFRRVVFSGSNNVCVNISKPLLLSQYPVITNNSIVSGDQTICSGATPAQIAGSSPLNGKGAGSYTFTWQDSTKAHSWRDISGHTAVSEPDYIPPALTDTTRYRRITFSSACYNISKSVIINVHKPVSGNSISLLGGLADTTICDGAVPHGFTGPVPSGGRDIPGDFTYQWSSSVDNSTWTDISTSATSRFYLPSALAAPTWFRRRATSGECYSESNALKVTVLPLITNNTIAGDQIVCMGNTPSLLTQAPGVPISGGGGAGSYSYLWESSENGTQWNPADGVNNASNGTYQPPVMAKTLQYRRNVKSGAVDCCTSTSNIIDLVMDTLPSGSTINAGPDTTIYSFDNIVRMVADPAIEGGTGKWTLLEGSGSFVNDADNNTRVNDVSKGLNRFLWTVTRGACKLEDMVDVVIYDIVIPEGFSPNNDPDGYNNAFIVKGLDLPNQEAELTIVNGAGTEVYSTSNRNGNEWIDWDGKNSNGIDMPEGTYYYLLRIRSVGNGSVFKKSGFIVLKRY